MKYRLYRTIYMAFCTQGYIYLRSHLHICRRLLQKPLDWLEISLGKNHKIFYLILYLRSFMGIHGSHFQNRFAGRL
jgi:hypothetical protein